MLYEEENKIAQDFFAECLTTLSGKAHDYASNKDALSNFKKVAFLCEIPVEKVFLVLMCVKLARLVELIDKPAVNESVHDSLKDNANYSCLMEAYKKEQEAKQ